MSFPFFFDTADVEYNQKKWDLMKDYVDPSYFAGVTTNPACFAKEGLYTLKEWETRTKELCEFVSEIREGSFDDDDDYETGMGLVYVQIPSDDLSIEKVYEWAEMIELWNGNSDTRIGLKLPPYKKYMDICHNLTLPVNITGLADASTLLACTTKNVTHVSIIPGRMEEVLIDAKSQVAHIMNANSPYDSSWKVITGSMRTLECLKWCVEYGTVPTIGKRVLDLVNETNVKEIFRDWEPTPNFIPQSNFAPTIDSKSRELSEAFFLQMNENGKKVCEEFLSLPSLQLKPETIVCLNCKGRGYITKP